MQSVAETLRSNLAYEPRPLKFGTSGRRGAVVDLTQLEVYISALGEIRYLQSLPADEGGIAAGDEFYIAHDLRPSSTVYVPEQGGRGELAQAVERAVRDAGMHPVNLGAIPTPALAAYAFARKRGSIMVTGSHIPFDRNGYKTNRSTGELLKRHEEPITADVERVRAEIYSQSFETSLFAEQGLFKSGHAALSPTDDAGREAYIRRYTDFFGNRALAGMRLLVYQHSAVGRDILVETLRRLGAQVVPAARSDRFIAIDTENIDAGTLAAIQAVADENRSAGPFDAVVSTDGDSDRPLVLGVERETGRLRFYPGDLVGMIVAQFLAADAVVVPITCNDGIDRSALAPALEPKTKIGSPYVVAGMEEARRKGRRVVCGWEANGGFLTGCDIERHGRVLAALPTRDAMLPIVATLAAAREANATVPELFARLPRRFSRAALIRDFPRSASSAIMDRYTRMEAVGDLGRIFESLGPIASLDYTDGVRVRFSNGDVVQFRPSGNADEMRIYAYADTQERADQIAMLGIAEPDGLLRTLQRSVVP